MRTETYEITAFDRRRGCLDCIYQTPWKVTIPLFLFGAATITAGLASPRQPPPWLLVSLGGGLTSIPIVLLTAQGLLGLHSRATQGQRALAPIALASPVQPEP